MLYFAWEDQRNKAFSTIIQIIVVVVLGPPEISAASYILTSICTHCICFLQFELHVVCQSPNPLRKIHKKLIASRSVKFTIQLVEEKAKKGTQGINLMNSPQQRLS